MANRGQLGRGVGYTHRQSGSARQRNVGKIVAQIGNFLLGHAGLLHALFESLILLRLPKINERDLEFFSTSGYGWRRSSSDEACLNTHRMGKRKSLPIVRVEYLHFGNCRFSGTLGGRR
jgi:hypothetical protein